MNERTMHFGPGNGLLGILTQASHPEPGAPTVILLNAGLLHRVGPNRMYVELARRLADLGFRSFRFDLSGIGDSELVGGDVLDIERSRLDVIAALDALDSTGGSKFVLMGLCTGAFNAFRTALVDERVAGCVLLDGYAYPTVRSKIRHYRTRVFELDRWKDWLSRKTGAAPHDVTSTTDDLIVFENEVVTKDRFEAELASLLDRRTAMLMVYTGLGPLAFNYARQMHDAFPNLDVQRGITVRYYPKADHTFRLPGNRHQLFDDVEAWLLATFLTADSHPSTTNASGVQ